MGRKSRFWLLPLLALALGCNGYVQGGDERGEAASGTGTAGQPGATSELPPVVVLPPPPADCDQNAAPPAPLRRLTRWEYDNTVADLLGDASRPAAKFTPEAAQFGFDNSAAGAVLSGLVIEQFEAAAEALATQATSNLPALLGCDVKAQGEDVCARQFIGTFFKRAYRRALGVNEQSRLLAFYQSSKTEFDFTTAISMLVSMALQSPKFLYRLEFGMPAPGTPTAVQLGSFEVASRISYLVTGSMPDAELITAAEKNLLSTPQQVLTHAARLLDSERGARVVRNFYGQWADLETVGNLKRNGSGFTAAIPALLVEEAETLADQVIRRGDGKLSTLLTAPYSFMNQALASYYGVQGPVGDAFVRVDLDATRYSGLLTQAGLMAELAHEDQPSPVKRGVFMREKVLCTEIPPPPDNVDAVLPAPDPTATARQQLTEKTSVEPCRSCHAAFNPLGFAFEHFDQFGRYRAMDGKLPVDSAGALTGTDADGAYTDHLGLMQLVAKGETARSCAVVNWFRYAYGREAAPADACSARQLGQGFSQGGGNLKHLILSLTQTRAFLYRDATLPGAPQ